MSTALFIFLFLILIIDSEDLAFLDCPHNDFGFGKALAAPSESSSAPKLASSSHWGGATELLSTAPTGLSSLQSPFERQRLHQGHHQRHEDLQCTMEVHSLSTASQTQCDALSNVSCTMADSYGQNLCAWSETKSTELGRLSCWELLLPGSSATPPKIAEPEAEGAEPTWQKVSTQQGWWQRHRSVQLCPIPAVPAWTLSTTGSTDGTAFAPTIDSTTMDAVTGAYGPHDAHAHAGPTNGKQCSDASANAHACAYVAAQCTGTGTEGAHCLPSEALCRPSPRHPAEGAQHLQEGREASHQRPRDGCQSTWRGAHSVRGGTLGALTAYQHLEGILGRGGQELVRLWQAIRAARRGTTSQDSYGQGTVSGCQGVHGSFQHFSWESGGARAQRRRGPAWGRRGECDADHREHPIAFDLPPTALQGHRIDSDRREGGKTPAIGRIKRGSRSCLAFQLGWLWTTLWCHSRQPDVSDFPATQALKWSHSIMRESTFLCECGAREGTEACFGNCSILSSSCTQWAFCATSNQKVEVVTACGFCRKYGTTHLV